MAAQVDDPGHLKKINKNSKSPGQTQATLLKPLETAAFFMCLQFNALWS